MTTQTHDSQLSYHYMTSCAGQNSMLCFAMTSAYSVHYNQLKPGVKFDDSKICGFQASSLQL